MPEPLDRWRLVFGKDSVCLYKVLLKQWVFTKDASDFYWIFVDVSIQWGIVIVQANHHDLIPSPYKISQYPFRYVIGVDRKGK